MTIFKTFTPAERTALQLHRLDTHRPSQLSDVFVLGMRYAQAQAAAVVAMAPSELRDFRDQRAAPASPAGLIEPVAEVLSWTNGSYSRNYKLKWLKDVPEGTKLYATPPSVAVSSESDAFCGKTADSSGVIPSAGGQP